MNIEQKITKLFQHRDDIPVFYIESGSRLWGMASPDSDFDVRGFHLPAKAQYYDYRKHRDLIEIMDGDFDFVSFELDKLFGLLAKSNPTVLEWVRAHIVYFNHFPQWYDFQQGLIQKIDYHALYYHYFSLARAGLKIMTIGNDQFTYKKVFYAIRGLMSAELATQQIMPELLITKLFQQINPADPLLHWAMHYLDIKKQQQEKTSLPLTEQTEILQLLQQKIEQLTVCAPKQQHNPQPLQNYLTEYSYQLKLHFYG